MMVGPIWFLQKIQILKFFQNVGFEPHIAIYDEKWTKIWKIWSKIKNISYIAEKWSHIDNPNPHIDQ